MQRLYQARDRIEAQFLLDHLARQGLSAKLLGDYLAGAAGDLPVDIYPTLWLVEDADLPRAREVLARFLAEAQAEVGPPWDCPRCGETVEGAFELCWNCGSGRP
jgi:hypothetical protein